jgi:NADH-quinone oxidoreductase subunit F
MKIENGKILQDLQKKYIKNLFPNTPRIMVGMGTCGIGNGADQVFACLKEAISANKLSIDLVPVGCFGFCAKEPLITIYFPKKPLLLLSEVTVDDVDAIINAVKSQTVPTQRLMAKIESWDFLTTSPMTFGRDYPDIPLWSEVPFFKGQKKIVLRDCGFINPTSIEEYIAVGGYSSLLKAVTESTPEKVLDVVKKANLRGRGGAGFPAGKKWELMRNVPGDKKYILCNADEGDPGAYMNRNEIEGDPHMLIEGMMIGAYAMGADEGVIYIRAEYPLAVDRIRDAVQQAKDAGIIGKNIFGSNFSFELHVVEGAGAFVCGEETALITSIENNAGRPRPRPPFPAQRGLWGKPTNINNVETWCNLAPIISRGAEWFTQTGSPNSPGTKVFSLVGKVKNTGLVEFPLGQPLEMMIYNMGGGSSSNKKIKAVQLGGPSGGCLPPEHFKTPVDYESLQSLGAIMGSGGVVVMDEYNCMPDVARYFIEFTSSESCGKCVPCRIGLKQILRMLNRFSQGKGTEQDLDKMESLAKIIRNASLCGLGQTAPNPILTTLRYFKHEYLEHIKEKRCSAGVCEDLAISPCENSCFLHINIPGFLELIQENREADAFRLFFEQNPMPAVTGRICQEFCNTGCRRLELDGAVNQREIHRYIADKFYQNGTDLPIIDQMIASNLPASGKKIAIIGAGPAGLSAGYFLARLGHSVTIYDAMDKPGGMLRYAIPAYRLPKSVVDKEIALIERFGVKIIPKVRIGKDIPLDRLETDNDAVFCAVGAWKEGSLGIPGTDLKGVYPSLQILAEIASGNTEHLGEKVIIIGGGNSAIDCARSAFRLGRKVTVVYRRERADMPAFSEEIEAAEHEGIKFMYLTAPSEIWGKNGVVTGFRVEKMKLGDYDSSGRRRPVNTGEFELLPCDTVIAAIGERVDSGIFKQFGLNLTKDGRFDTDFLSLQTNRPKFFAGGDAVTGPSTVTQAMAYGKRAAKAIDQFLRGSSKFDVIFSHFDYQMVPPTTPQGGIRRKPGELSLPDRTHGFDEVVSGYCEDDYRCEACRCMRCDVKKK